MNVPEGFKQTEVGVIPQDWVVSSLGANVTVNSGESPSKFKILTSGIPYFKVDELNNSSKYAEASKYCIEYCKSVPDRSLIFPKRGASIFLNKIRILKQPSYMDTNLMTITVSENWEHEYIYYQLLYIGLWKVADTTSVPHINNKHIIPFQIPLPPTRAEQTAIAAALSDMDALIEGVEKLLEKKRRIKQGAMQELLTAKTRLPGFKGKWEVRRLGNVCRITTGKKDVNEGNPNGQFPFFTCSRYHTFSDSYSFDTEAILVAGNGEVGNLHYINGKFEAYQRTYVLSDFTAQVSYLWQQLTAYLADSLGLGKIGSSIPYIKKENLNDFEFKSPHNSAEQTAIAAILSDMDSEIEQLETQLTKYRQLKTGMMQELLTGKKRLV